MAVKLMVVFLNLIFLLKPSHSELAIECKI